MLHILLTILKVIGIIILVLISLVILIIAAILFVPIRYSIDAIYDRKVKNLDFKIKITYLLHLISVKYIYKDDGLSIKIFGIKTHFFDKETKAMEEKINKETKMFEKMSSEIKDNMTEMPEVYEQLKKIDEERDRLAENVNKTEENIENNNKDNDTEENTEENTEEFIKVEKQNIFSRIYSKIKAIIIKIKYRFIKFCDTIKKICKNVNDLKEFISDDNTKEAFGFLKKEALILLKHIRPRRIKGYVHFGFDDPSYTGNLLGLIYMILRGSPKEFRINPDFENKVFDGEIHAKGRVQCYLLLIIGIRLYKNDNLKLLLERRRTNGRE
ncbi:DUF2953 domain-containing protein [Bovifimicola ammoniilytica]|uniref:DUF2953 domain-containing protein n=1 Tax=Bovifimicola ammoniilytica TaxID=2981720 RepID=UPI000820D108|nr:DUF2953 domain-containing protein [Bovifimicola ammoniilytica]MCU6753446.1 DUF2953 domain-containing protein [Bovifimicola ammoniilytica]SCJ62380.1 Protein of uncharacterised function (DUF2953) [uncultured Eubacterium sp.]